MPILLQFLRMTVSRRDLLRELFWRDLKMGHAAHGFGGVWVYVHPIVIVGTYLLIFGFVLGGRIAVSAAFPGNYPSYIMAGLVPWLVTANVLGRAPAALASNANLVKQVVFPIEILPVANTLVCFWIYMPALLLVLIYKFFIGGGLPLFTLALPIAFLLHATTAAGVIFALSSVTPFVRDVREFVNVYSAIAMYFTPAVYLPDWAPPPLRPLIYLNPFSYFVWVYQDVLFFGAFAHPVAWIVCLVISVGSLYGGYSLFRRLKPFLGNVL
jgi:lipopolysaccharide transport system permease protein